MKGRRTMEIYWTKIKEIIDESKEVKTYQLACPIDFTWEAGAHVHLALKGFNEGAKPNRQLVRHMSISTLPSENQIGITTRIKEQPSLFKATLNQLRVGDEVALFKIHSNVSLLNKNQKVYFFSSGVGIATFRPIVLDYLRNGAAIKNLYSLSIESSREFLFQDLFQSQATKNFQAEFVDNRTKYYQRANELALDQTGHYYIVGSDDFLKENIAMLKEKGISEEQIFIDKREQKRQEFFA